MSRPELVSEPEGVTPAWLTEALRASGALPEGRVAGFTAATVGTGQVGHNVRFALELEGAPGAAPRSVVGKFASRDPVSRATGVAQGNYLREVRFYQELARTVDIRTPRCFFADIDPASSRFVLLMEDLAPACQGDQIRGCTVEDAALALRELAALHAPRYADPALARLDWLQRRTPEGAMLVEALYRSVWPGFLQRFGHALDADAVALMERLGSSLAAWMLSPSGPLTITHGDYRLDNMLFGTAEGGYPLAVVDWQTPSLGFALADASYFLGAGLLPETRRANERDLLREYHRELSARGVRDLSFERCFEDYRRFSFSGVVMAVVASMIVGQSERGDAMFLAMATRHAAHALDLEATKLLE